MATYEGVVFLNNVGTTLLQRQQYEESVETFADAFHLHRCVIAEQQSGFNDSTRLFDGPQNQVNFMQEILLRASKRLAQSNAQQNGNVKHLMIDPFIVLDTSNADCTSSLLKYGSAIDQIDFVIRMNHHESESEIASESRARELDSAIFFLNYGVACKRASSSIDCSDDMSNALHFQSTKLFDLSHQIVNRVIESLISVIKHGKQMLEVERLLERALMISMFTTAQISDIMYWENSLEGGVEFHSNFEKSYRSFQALTQRLRSFSIQHAASA